MKRNIGKTIKEGHALVEAQGRYNITLSELMHFVNELENDPDTGITDTVYNSFLFGVAVGARISKTNGAKGKNCAM